jgi:molybdopterin molybdotransferase
MVTARLLLAPVVAGLTGRPEALEWRRMRLAGPLTACDARETFHRARLTPDGAVPLINQDSNAQRTLAAADLLLRSRPHDPARQAGDEIDALDF